MNSQHENYDQEPYLAHCPSFRDEGRKSISVIDLADRDESDGDAEFEFSVGGGGGGDASLNEPADEIIANGQILPPAYPVFNQRLLRSDPDPDPSVQLRALLISDRAEFRSGSQSSTSSLESDAYPAPGTYCEWTPRSAPQSPSRVKKSSSTGSEFGSESASRRWSVRDLVVGRRSHSDGKQKFVFLNDGGSGSVDLKEKAGASLSPIASPKRESKKKGEEKKKKKVVKEMDLVTAHKLFYGKDKKDGEKTGRRSFLPYRPELVPLFTTSRTHHLHPF